MKKTIRMILAALALLVLAVAGRRFAHRKPAAEAGEESARNESVAHVQVVPLERKTISEKIVRYGTVIAQPGRIHSVSIAFETRVRHILVAPGQFVRPGDPLLEMIPSAASQLQFQQALNASDAARKDLAQTQERFNLKLATNQEMGTARKNARDADLQLASLRKQGLGQDGLIRAEAAGLAAKVDVQDGQIVAAGGPLVEIVAEDEIEVKLGVEAEDLKSVRPGRPIALFPVDDAAAGTVEGTVRIVTGRVDPTTRLVDVYVSLPKGIKLLLDGYVRGEFTRSSPDVFVVPSAAILPGQGGYGLFTVKENHAVSHAVQTGLENDRETEVAAPGLKEGDAVVVAGNYELEDGMSVEVQTSK